MRERVLELEVVADRRAGGLNRDRRDVLGSDEAHRQRGEDPAVDRVVGRAGRDRAREARESRRGRVDLVVLQLIHRVAQRVVVDRDQRDRERHGVLDREALVELPGVRRAVREVRVVVVEQHHVHAALDLVLRAGMEVLIEVVVHHGLARRAVRGCEVPARVPVAGADDQPVGVHLRAAGREPLAGVVHVANHRARSLPTVADDARVERRTALAVRESLAHPSRDRLAVRCVGGDGDPVAVLVDDDRRGVRGVDAVRRPPDRS